MMIITAITPAIIIVRGIAGTGVTGAGAVVVAGVATFVVCRVAIVVTGDGVAGNEVAVITGVTGTGVPGLIRVPPFW
jgi:hypothetical protein